MVIIMARRTTPAKNTTPAFAPAEAFLRLSLVDSKGNKHRLPKDAALYIKHFVSEQMIKAATANPEQEFTFVGTINVVDTKPKDAIEF